MLTRENYWKMIEKETLGISLPLLLLLPFLLPSPPFHIYISEKAMAPHSSTPAWKVPWMEEPGRLQSMGLLRVRHD